MTESARHDSPFYDASISDVCLVWLAHHFPLCRLLTFQQCLLQFAPMYAAYYHQPQPYVVPLYGYIVVGTGDQDQRTRIELTCQLDSMDQLARLTRYPPDTLEDEEILCDEQGRCARFVCIVRPGDHLVFQLSFSHGLPLTACWWMSTHGIQLQPSRTSCWFVMIEQDSGHTHPSAISLKGLPVSCDDCSRT